jgi:hypothetical protein
MGDDDMQVTDNKMAARGPVQPDASDVELLRDPEVSRKRLADGAEPDGTVEFRFTPEAWDQLEQGTFDGVAERDTGTQARMSRPNRSRSTDRGQAPVPFVFALPAAPADGNQGLHIWRRHGSGADLRDCEDCRELPDIDQRVLEFRREWREAGFGGIERAVTPKKDMQNMKTNASKNVSRLIDHPKGNAMVERLQARLQLLMQWRFNIGGSEIHYPIHGESVDGRSVEEIQADVSKLLEDPVWIDREIIATALRQAHVAVAKGIHGNVSLKMLLRPPLKAWQGHWVLADTPAGWRSLSEEDDDFDVELRDDYEMVRLGNISNACALEVDGEVSEIIECWGSTFWPDDLYGMGCRADFECQTFYRYPAADHWEGKVYPDLEQALRGVGGVSVKAALEEGLAWGLDLDDVDDPFFTCMDLLRAAGGHGRWK